MLANAGDISFEQVLRMIFGIFSGSLALCILMLFQCLWLCFQCWDVWDVT